MLIVCTALFNGCTYVDTEHLEDTDEVASPTALVQISHNVWKLHCWGIAPSDASGLWSDAPGAGTQNESAFFWLVTNDPGDEFCVAATSVPGMSTTSFPNLHIRIAVNDGAIFKVELKNGSESCFGGTVVAALTTSRSEAHSGFITKNTRLPLGKTIDEVCLILDDSPDNVLSERASALIDEIRVWNSSTGAIGWQETFSKRY
jgi:hypothetical protein